MHDFDGLKEIEDELALSTCNGQSQMNREMMKENINDSLKCTK